MHITCTPILNNIFYVVKNISMTILIMAPIIAIISFSVLLVKMAQHPEEKKNNNRFKNIVIALITVFMIPTIVNALLYMLGETTSISSCYINSVKFTSNSEYIDLSYGKEKKGLLIDSDQYEKGVPKTLNFSCTSNTVKSQFSCETLKIVEKHLYDVNYNNFRSVINSYGGFNNYARSLGGVFSEYYGKDLNVETELEFQKVAEYTFGWMYMYGMDYYNGGGDYHNWGVGYGQSGHSDDSFYQGNQRASKPTGYFDQYFDEVISGTGGNSALLMATECGPAAQAPLYKGGILKRGQSNNNRTFITRLQDLRPGDLMHFFDHYVDRSNRSTWGQGRHVVVVGEVYDDRIVLYDGGSHFQTTRNFKRTIKRVTTPNEEYNEIRREFGFSEWSAERFKTLKQ